MRIPDKNEKARYDVHVDNVIKNIGLPTLEKTGHYNISIPEALILEELTKIRQILEKTCKENK